MTPTVSATLSTRDGRVLYPGQSGPRLILSVFPLPQSLELRHEGLKQYYLPAAPKGKYSTLLVHDTFAWNRNWHADAFELFQAPISAASVAENLIQRWSNGLIGTKDGLGPGIMICAGLEPTPEEIDVVNQRQSDYFSSLINEADTLFGREEFTAITDTHRLAADWMGVNDREWAKPITRVEMRACPACAEQIRGAAKVCRWCHTDLREFEKGAAAPKGSK